MSKSKPGYRCHHGIADATVLIWKEIQGLLKEDEYKQYSRITVVGHSLGGGECTGTASLACISCRLATACPHVPAKEVAWVQPAWHTVCC